MNPLFPAYRLYRHLWARTDEIPIGAQQLYPPSLSRALTLAHLFATTEEEILHAADDS